MLALVRAALRLAPRGFRDRFASEILSATRAALAEERQRHGRVAMAVLGARAAVDAVRTARIERQLDGAAGGPWSDWRGDLRYALRGWRRTPGFSLTVLLTLSLSLALATAVFSFADGYLFRGLPVPDGDRLYRVRDPNGVPIRALKAAETVALRQSPVADLGFAEWSVKDGLRDLILADRRLSLFAYEVNAGFRKTVELPLLSGHDFQPSDHQPQPTMPAWLTHRFWTRVFGSDPSVIGRVYPVTSYGDAIRELRIVGILGPAFASFDLNNEPPDIVVPERTVVITPNTYSFPIVRLPRDVSLAQAEARIGAALQAASPASDGRPRVVQLRSLHDAQVAGGAPTARLLFAGALLAVGLAAVNLVHLMLTRGAARAVEMATRNALGASRWRLVRLLVTESVVIGSAGIGLGVLGGWWLSSVIAALVPGLPTNGRNLALVPMLFDARVVLFAVGLGILVMLLGTVWPAWIAARAPRPSAIRSSGGEKHVSRRASRVLLASELALATMVLFGVAFIGTGIWRYFHQALGFEYTDRVRIWIERDDGKRATPADLLAAVEVLQRVDGVSAIGMFDSIGAGAIEVPGVSIDPKTATAAGVSAGHFAAWGVTLRAGRLFDEGEYVANAPVAVVDELFARTAWPAGDPMGAVVRVGGVPRQVIGVVPARRDSLQDVPRPRLYVPVAEYQASPLVAWVPGSRAAFDAVNARLTGALRDGAPGVVPTISRLSFDSLFLREVGEPQFQAPIVTAFGVLTLLLAGVGVFGLVSYLVNRRRREFGVRIALGAPPAAIWRGVIRESVIPAAIGLAIGIPAALALEAIVNATMFGLPSSGVVSAAIVAAGLMLTAIVAALAPARRATRVDPVQILRAD